MNLSPRLLRLSSSSRVEQPRHPRLREYSWRWSLYGERCSNFVRRDLNHHRATLKGKHNLGLSYFPHSFFFLERRDGQVFYSILPYYLRSFLASITYCRIHRFAIFYYSDALLSLSCIT